MTNHISSLPRPSREKHLRHFRRTQVVGENVSFPDLPWGTGLSGSAFSSCHLSCQKLSSSHFSLYPSISLPPHVSLQPFVPSSIYVSRTHLAISIKMREKSSDRTRLSNKGIVYRWSNQKIWAQTIKILYDTYIIRRKTVNVAANFERKTEKDTDIKRR